MPTVGRRYSNVRNTFKMTPRLLGKIMTRPHYPMQYVTGLNRRHHPIVIALKTYA